MAVLRERRSTLAPTHYRNRFEESLTANFRISGAGVLLACNRTLVDLLGLPSIDQARGRPLNAFFRPADYDKLLDTLEGAGQIENFEMEIVLPDGSAKPVLLVALAQFGPDSQILEIRGSFLDLSALRPGSTEARKAPSTRAQQMDGVGKLAGGIAHDFNNLLTAITGYSDLLLSRTAPEDPSHRPLSEIKKASDRAAKLTSELLAYSRRQVLQLDTVTIERFLGGIERALRKGAPPEVGVSVESSDPQGSIHVDRLQLEDAFAGLTRYGADSLGVGDCLFVRHDPLVVTTDLSREGATIPTGSYARFELSSSAPPLEETEISKGFEPSFARIEGSESRMTLANAYGVIKRIEGFVFIRKAEGASTLFEVLIPMSSAEEATTATPDPQTTEEALLPKVDDASLNGTESVLLVEDEDAVRDYAAEVLRTKGYRLQVAANGLEGLEICRKSDQAIDLLVTDVVMPGMNGPDLAERAKAILPGVKVLFLSGYTDDTLGHQGILTADTNFLQKPFTPQQLAKMVRRVLETDT